MAETLFVTTTPGLEPALERELHALRLEPKVEPGGATVRGDVGLHRVLNLELRTASRVLLRVAEVAPKDLGKVDVSPYVAGASEVIVSASVHKARMRANELEELARRSWKLRSPPKGPASEESSAPRIQLRLEGDRCTVSVDTSGELLHRRGYRQEVSHAPLRETLGAGLLVLAGYDGTAPFWDPMCGSGTILIEAALLSARRAPGLERHFAFERFRGFDEAAFGREKDDLRARATKPSVPLTGTDLHSGALGAARRNAKRAGVFEALKLERQDVTKLAPAPSAPGFIVTNPPYGKRVGESGDLVSLYRGIGETFRRAFKGWRFGVLVPEEKLEAALALKPAESFRIQNGGIWCNFLVGEVR